MNNLDRAQRAERCVSTQIGFGDRVDNSDIHDLINDLLHALDQRGADVRAELTSAIRSYLFERALDLGSPSTPIPDLSNLEIDTPMRKWRVRLMTEKLYADVVVEAQTKGDARHKAESLSVDEIGKLDWRVSDIDFNPHSLWSDSVACELDEIEEVR